MWAVWRWPLFGAVVVVAFLLGFAGFRIYFDGQPGGRGATDYAYLSLQLFVLESGSVPETGAPWQLEVARLLAPATTGIAIAAALAAVFREELEELRLRRRRRHVVVCGLGERGAKLVRSFLTHGYRVVGVELEEGNPVVPELRRDGALVVIGDARNSKVLRRARVTRAEYIVAVTGADDTNAEVAIRASEHAPDQGSALTCLAHIQDPELCALLRSEELAAEHEAGYRLDFFNIYEQGARALLDDHPPFRSDTQEPHVAVIGLTPLGQAVIVEAARQWWSLPDAGGRRIHVAALDPEASSVIDVLRRRYRQLDRVADLQGVEIGFGHLDCSILTSRGQWEGVYVCVDDDSSAFDAAIQARQCLANTSTPVIVELTRSAGLAELLQRPTSFESLHAFDLLDRTLRPELLQGGTYEILARAIHSEYVEEQRGQGATVASNPSLVPWEHLPETLRESNRDQAHNIGTKLEWIKCGIAPLSDWDAVAMRFSEPDVEELAKLEHKRWTDQRQADGWKRGPKDIDAKVSPYLIPWEQLTDDIKEQDRMAVRNIPGLLARAGYQVVRKPTS